VKLNPLLVALRAGALTDELQRLARQQRLIARDQVDGQQPGGQLPVQAFGGEFQVVIPMAAD
jgi:hypothetical protein